MTISEFIRRCDTYADRRKIGRARLSTILFNDGKKIGALADGRDIGVRTLERAVKALEELEQATVSSPATDKAA